MQFAAESCSRLVDTNGHTSARLVEADPPAANDISRSGADRVADYSSHSDVMAAVTEVDLASATNRTAIMPGQGASVAICARLQVGVNLLADIRANLDAARRNELSHNTKLGPFVIEPSPVARRSYQDV